MFHIYSVNQFKLTSQSDYRGVSVIFCLFIGKIVDYSHFRKKIIPSMKKLLQIVILVLSSMNSLLANDTIISLVPKVDTSYWKMKCAFGLNGTQSSFVNWSAGGRNNISAIAFISSMADYKKDKWLWKNSLDLALGGMKYIDAAGKKQGFQKTDDKIDLSTNIGYKLREKLYLSMIGGFRTQFMDGYNFPNDSVKVSTFMAPGYINLALGLDYTPNEHFSLFFSPLSSKMTIVNDETLANLGAFGVEKAVFSETDGVVAGKGFRAEFGAYLKISYTKDLFKNVNFKGKVEFFSNYANNPQNIDVNADVLWTFKVNTWLQASLNWTLIYDDDINIRDTKGNSGPRTQFKSVLGLGLSYTLRNFKEN